MRFKEFSLFEVEKPNLDLAAGLPGFSGATPQISSQLATTPSNTPSTAANAPGLVKLSTSNRGTEVATAQAALLALGYPLAKYGVDGIKGPETTAALKSFQQDSKIQVTGNIDAATASELNTRIAANPELVAKVKSAEATAARSTKQLPPLSQDAATTGKVGEVLNLIARYESKGNYNIILGGKTVPNLTKMTLAQVYDLQRQMVRSGKESSAVGRYQFIRKTLEGDAAQLGMDPNTTVFDEKTQDALAIYELRRNAKMDQWLDGNISDETFLNRIARIWASIPTTSGSSYYAGVGSNRAGLSSTTALASLQTIRNSAQA